MMDLPEELENRFRQDIAEYEEKQHMAYITTVERAGIKKGLLEGIELGLDLNFGEAGLKLFPGILEIRDHEKLQAVLKAIKTADTPDALRHLWQEEINSEK